MASRTNDFDRFLEANYPTDWLRISVKDVKDDVVNSIISRYEKKYEIWKRIPEWIKNFYGDRLPNELFDGNEPYDRFVEDVERRVVGELAYDYAKLNETVYKAVMSDEKSRRKVSEKMEAGYLFENSCKLVYQEKWRGDIINNPNLSDDEKLILHIASWRETAKIIKDDWKENQRDKYREHAIKEYDRELFRSLRAKKMYDERTAIMHRIKAARKRVEVIKLIEEIDDKEIRESKMKVIEAIEKKHKENEKRQKMEGKEKIKSDLEKKEYKNLKDNVNPALKSVLR